MILPGISGSIGRFLIEGRGTRDKGRRTREEGREGRETWEEGQVNSAMRL